MMKRTALVVIGASLALTACQKADAPDAAVKDIPVQDVPAVTASGGAEPVDTTGAPKTDAPKVDAKAPETTPKSDPKNDKGLASIAGFTALGTEPFWNFKIAGTSAKYSSPENQAGSAFTVKRTDSAQGVAFTGAMEGKRVTILITPQSCSDGMSDRTHAYTVKAMIDDNTLNGCANPA